MRWNPHETDETLFRYTEQRLESATADRVAAHVAQCSQCCQVVDRYRTLVNAFEQPAPMTPSGLWERALRSHNDTVPLPVLQGSKFHVRSGSARPFPFSFRTSVRLGIALSVVAAAAFFFYPVATKNGIAGKVQAAGQKVHSWHGAGWKIRYGQKEPWEVWWRNSPFFFREEAGSDIELDDSRRRVHLRPDSRIATIGPSVRTPPPGPWEGIAGLIKYGKKVSETDTAITYRTTFVADREPNGEPWTRWTWALSKENWLPLSYRQERGREDHWQTVEYADYFYNEPIPPQSAVVSIPSSMTVMDYAKGDDDAAESPSSLTQTRNGLKVKVSSVTLAPGGVATISIEAWLGGRPLAGMKSPYTDYTLWMRDLYTSQNESSRPWPLQKAILSDDQGRPYLFAEGGGPVGAIEMEQSPKHYLLFPLEPLKESEPDPRFIEMPLWVNASVMKKQSGSDGWSGREQVNQAAFLFRIPLPSVASNVNLTGWLNEKAESSPGAKETRDRWMTNLPGYLAEERALGHYFLGRYREAAEEWEQAMQLRPGPSWGDSRKLNLAEAIWKSEEKTDYPRAVALRRDFLKTDIPKMRPIEAREQEEQTARKLLRQIEASE